MNLDKWQGKWKQARGSATQLLGKLINDRLLVFVGEQDAVNGRIQERVGRTYASRARPRGASVRAFLK
jgi:uncharacterized protein YjbJ (UPF0337 family)